MLNESNIHRVIQSRRSCRHYLPKALEPELRQKVIELLRRLDQVPFITPLRFRLIDAEFEGSEELKGLGTYGFIRHARAYIVGAVKITSGSFMEVEDYGYALERIILQATRMGLGTCWLGASFTRSRFAQRMNMAEGEIIPAITPIGYPAAVPTLRDRLIKWSVGSHTRKQWSAFFFDDDFSSPLSEQDAGSYLQPLAMVRLAPSGSNRQPWRIIKVRGQNTFHFCLKVEGPARVNQKLKIDHIPRLDMGIAMCHFELSSRELGLKGGWKRLQPEAEIFGEGIHYIVSWVGEDS